LKLRITIDGKEYVADVELLEDDEASRDSAAHHASPASASGAHVQNQSGWDADGKLCRSPWKGLVVKVNVRAGQQVEAGEVLIVLEAMKMETNITAPRAAIVKSMLVTQGDSVKQNQTLAELE
jgi:methylmalonyl-CoA carboxyltransferase 1.3S subunit